MPVESLRSTRDLLISDTSLQGEAFCRALSNATDSWLSALATAAGGSQKKMALLAVGGYGRQELCPFSDLDLLLVHDSRNSVQEFADQLWYPVWDQGVNVDHAVRRPKEVLSVASSDLRVALGLLDARLVWGDPSLAIPLIDRVKDLWRSRLAAEFLPALEEQMEERHRVEGDVAFLLEPNLKEAHGGLRDVNVLRSLPSCAPHLTDLVNLSVIDGAAAVLVAVRVELHRSAARELDRMLLQDQDHLAASLGFSDDDVLCRTVSEAGRAIASLSDDTWRRRRLWEPGSLQQEQAAASQLIVEEGIVVVDGEVSPLNPSDVVNDPSLIWRLGAVAGERDLPISFHGLTELCSQPFLVPEPWSPEIRDALVRMLIAGHQSIPAFESIDRVGLVTRFLPEWDHVRHFHQRNAYHRFTVDRHLLEAAANASTLTEGIDRPDLLVIGALFHDIGKGLPGDHTELGIEILASLGPRLGYSDNDVRILQTLVRHHLLLADVATRRDLSDPRTIENVVMALETASTVRILGALTKADSLATGSSAWSPWKEQLVDELVRRSLAALGDPRDAPAFSGEPPARFLSLLKAARSSGTPQVLVEPPSVIVAAPDRPGLLAQVAGTLALHRLDVHSANVEGFDGVILDIFSVDTLSGHWPPADRLVHDLEEVLGGNIDLTARLNEQALTYAAGRRPWSARPATPTVKIDNEASFECTVVEIRALDRIGLLHGLTEALFSLSLDVVAARVATIGGDVVDAFYVRTPEGEKLTDPSLLSNLEHAMMDRLENL